MEEIYDGSCASHQFCCGEFGEAGHNPSETMADVRQGALKLKDKKSISQKTGLGAFIKEARKNRIWRYATSMLAVLVVFVTAYVLIVPGITLTTYASLTITDITYDKTVYSNGDYTTVMNLEFGGVEVSDVKTNNYTYQIYLPEGVSCLDDYLKDDAVLNGYDGNTLAFTYHYYCDSNGLYYIILTFDESYIASYTSDDATVNDGYIEFDATLSTTLIQSDGSIKVTYNESQSLVIPVTDISTTDSTYTPNADISVSKTSKGYDSATNSITYEVTVYSKKGTTDEITLTDIMEWVSSNFSIKSVAVDSVTYAKSDEYNNYSSSTDVSGYTSSYSDNKLTVTLPKLEETDYGSAYTVTYTVQLNDITNYELTDTLNNSVTASATDTWKGGITITDTDSETTVVSNNLLSKSGEYDETTGTITWTMTVNKSQFDIAGTTLTDEMFDGLSESDLTISPNSGYTVSTDSNGDLQIKFGETAAGAGNYNTYTITYTTDSGRTLGQSGNGYVKNDAELSGGILGEGSVSGVGSVYVSGGGAVSKSMESSTTNSDGTVEVTWKTVYSIPESGIAAGTVLADYLGGSGSYTSITDQYFTYTQLSPIINYYYALPAYDGDTYFGSLHTYVTVEIYDITALDWFDAKTISENKNTYENDHFTAFRITFNEAVDLESSATLTLSYTSTVVTTGASTSSNTEYWNYAQAGSKSSGAKYTYYAKVVKMNSYGGTATSTTNTSDGVLTWQVKMYVESGSDSTYTITDALPKGVTLSNIYIGYQDTYGNASYNEMTISGSSISGTLDSTVLGTIATDSETGAQTVTLTLDSADYTSIQSSGGYVWVKYVVAMGESLKEIAEGESNVTHSLENTVTVEKDGSTYGTASQTQNVTYGDTSSSTSSKEVAKGYSWDSYNSEMSYYVVLNPEGADLLDGSNELEFSDVVSANFLENWGLYLSLKSGSVHIYKAVAVADGEDTGSATVYTGGDGNSYIAGDEITVDSLTYSQDTTWTSATTGTTTHTISATVPDQTPMIVVYTYYVNVVGSDGVLQSLYNTATLKGESEIKTVVYSSGEYREDNNNAGIFGSQSLTLTKVVDNNINNTLSGATYRLYWYQGGTWVNTGLTFTTGDNGSFSIGKDTLKTYSYYAVNTAYKLVEIDAPDGYILDTDTEWYFYWYDSSESTSSYPSGFTTQENVYNLNLVSAQIYASNTEATTSTTSVSVDKKWVDVNETELDDSKIDVSEIEVTLYQYEESDLEEDEEDSSGVEQVNINIFISNNGNIPNEMDKIVTVNKGEEVTLVITADEFELYGWTMWDSDKTQVDQDWTLNGATYYELVISSDKTQTDIYLQIGNNASSVTVKGEESTSISGVSSSGLPHDSDGNFAGTVFGTYTITSTKDWSLTVDDLPYEYYDDIGEKHTYYYYFVETAVDGYYTTYSSSLGTTDGGSLTITNTQIPTTEVSVEKEWCDQNGDEISDTSKFDDITVDLYRTEVAASGDDSSSTTDTITVTVNYSTDYSYGNVITKEVPVNTSFTITLTPYSESESPHGYTTSYVGLGSQAYDWLTFTSNEISIEANYVTQNIAFDIVLVSDVSISYTGESNDSSSGTLYYSADLPTDGTYVGSYTLSYDNSWKKTIADLPGAYIDDDGTVHYYYYYFRESAIMYYDTTYSTSSGVQSGTITITNTYNPSRKYTSAKVSKVWEDSSGESLSDSSLTSASAQFQLWQVLMASDETYLTDSDGATLVIPYGSPVTLSSSTGWDNTWVTLPTTTTYNSKEYTCLYLITEVSATTGTTATYITSYGTSSETAARAIGSITVDGVTYYVVAVGENSSNSDAPVITVTNTTSEEEKDSTSITVAKEWANVSGIDLSGYTVTFQLVQLLKSTDDDTYYSSGDDKVTNYSTEDVDGNTISYSYDMAITGSDSESYTWSSLPVTVTIGSVTYTCEYYIIESAVKDSSGDSVADQYTVSYSNISATTYTDADNLTYYQVTNGGTATVTNTYTKEEETTISFNVIKNWEENGSSLQVSEVTLTVQLLQVLTAAADGYDPLYNKSSTTDVNYTQTITFTNSSTDEVTWSGLPATMTVNGVKYTCSYYITEASVVNGSGTPVADLYTVAYTNGDVDATSYEYKDTSSNEATTYYAVSDGETITITNTAKNTAVLPSTGGSGSNGKLVLLGSSIALLALMLILARRRKREVVG